MTDVSTGVWLIGARGSVATTVIAGAAAIRTGLAAPTGCVTEQPDFAEAWWPPGHLLGYERMFH